MRESFLHKHLCDFLFLARPFFRPGYSGNRGGDLKLPAAEFLSDYLFETKKKTTQGR